MGEGRRLQKLGGLPAHAIHVGAKEHAQHSSTCLRAWGLKLAPYMHYPALPLQTAPSQFSLQLLGVYRAVRKDIRKRRFRPVVADSALC